MIHVVDCKKTIMRYGDISNPGYNNKDYCKLFFGEDEKFLNDDDRFIIFSEDYFKYFDGSVASRLMMFDSSHICILSIYKQKSMTVKYAPSISIYQSYYSFIERVTNIKQSKLISCENLMYFF